MPLPVRRRGGGRLVANVDARVQSDRHQRARGVGLDDAQPQGLRHVAGILDLQHVRPSGRADAERIGFPTYVGRGGARLELRDIAQRVMDGLAHAVAQGSAQSAGQSRQRRQLDLLPPAGTGGVDFEDLAQFSAGFDGRRLRRNDDQLHPALGDRPLPAQRLAECPRPAGVLLGGDHDVVNALFFRQGQFQRNGFPAAAHVLFAGPQLPLLGVEQLGLDLHAGVGRHGQQVRNDLEAHRLAGRKDHRGMRDADQQRIARCAADQQAIFAVVELQVAELGGDVGQGNFDLRPALRITRGGELHNELGVGRGGDDEIDAVVGPRRALADHQPAVLQPHRARFVGLDPQRPRLGNGPAADGDGAFP